MKTYHGVREEDGCVVTVRSGGLVAPLNPRFDLRRHSPDGFEFGYGGSGPAQLALAICADVLGDDERAQRVYQKFKFRVIGSLKGDTFELTEDEVRRVIDGLEHEAELRETGGEG